jgi:hypothetical protein
MVIQTGSVLCTSMVKDMCDSATPTFSELCWSRYIYTKFKKSEDAQTHWDIAYKLISNLKRDEIRTS